LARSAAEYAAREEIAGLLSGGFASVDVTAAFLLATERGHAFGHQ
jgi:hypothetical protein